MLWVFHQFGASHRNASVSHSGPCCLRGAFCTLVMPSTQLHNAEAKNCKPWLHVGSNRKPGINVVVHRGFSTPNLWLLGLILCLQCSSKPKAFLHHAGLLALLGLSPTPAPDLE